jgi:hypothetical protein
MADEMPEAPEPSVYDEIMEMFNKALMGAGGLPKGGKAGQILTKDSDEDYDYSWQDNAGGSGGGIITVDQSFNAESANAQSGIAVAEAIGEANAYTDTEIEKVKTEIGGGSGGGGGGKLYRHDICLDDVQESGACVYFTLINNDPVSYDFYPEIDEDEGFWINPFPERFLSAIPRYAYISATGTPGYEGEGEYITHIVKDNDERIVEAHCGGNSIYLWTADISDTVTEIPISSLPNLDLEVF